MGDSKRNSDGEPETRPERDGAGEDDRAEAAKSLSFEGALEQLEGTVSRLEVGELPLEEALALFESGVKLSRQCQATLDEAQQRVEILVADRKADPDAPESVPFEPDEDTTGDEATSAADDENVDDGDDDEIEDEE